MRKRSSSRRPRLSSKFGRAFPQFCIATIVRRTFTVQTSLPFLRPFGVSLPFDTSLDAYGSKDPAIRSYNNRRHVSHGALPSILQPVKRRGGRRVCTHRRLQTRFAADSRGLLSVPGVSFSMPARQDICHMLPRRRLTTLLALTSDAAARGRCDAHTPRAARSFKLFARAERERERERLPLGNCVHSRTQTAALAGLIPPVTDLRDADTFSSPVASVEKKCG